jgi:cold-inducible RNA-binding protein
MKLYVGNLSWSIDDKALGELFASYGDIDEAVLIKDKFSGRSKGFGFVTFSKDEDAQKAISEMHEKDVEGRPLTVSEARPMVPRDNDRREEHSNDGPSEAPMANPSEINGQVEEASSSAEEGEDAIETTEEAKEDASSDEPATEDAPEAEETEEKAA